MRISDDRYNRDRLRIDVALRFIRHEARTQTTREWTGLTDDRIRKLYRAYLASPSKPASIAPSTGAVQRHRGRSPHSAMYFMRTLRRQQEAALLASLCALLGVIPLKPSPEAARTLPNVMRGELLCQAYEAYKILLPGARIEFEYAVLLVTALARGEELRLNECPGCHALVVADRFTLRDALCMHCASSTAIPPTYDPPPMQLSLLFSPPEEDSSETKLSKHEEPGEQGRL